ncbi:MAG: FAD-dependent oxidoreductase [Geminicoccaceae bacterium]|nr:FAD-dependent oxidoreductase [Geminicoccaceae bacterium]
MNATVERVDVLIVGGGPAGLAAARELRANGAGKVVVLDREPEAGGIPRHCGHYPFGMRELKRVLRGPDYARRLADRADAAGAEIRPSTSVTKLHAGGTVDIATGNGLASIQADRVLLATGVRESSRAARLIGGTKPGGIMSTGALQGLVYLQKMRPFERPVILGSELVAFSALLTCRHAGIRPVAMIEPHATATARWPVAALARIMGVPLLLRHRVGAIRGTRRVSNVEVIDAGGTTHVLATDGVVVSGEFLPESSLVRESSLEFDGRTGGPAVDPWFRCSDPAFFAAGNLLRPVETAGWSWNEGRRAGRLIARSLEGGLPDPEPASRLRLTGDILKYAMPQRLPELTRSFDGLRMNALQLRVVRPVVGNLVMRAGGRIVYSRPLRSRPERRILLPLADIALDGYPVVEVTVEECVA